jgi:hypothetical protein
LYDAIELDNTMQAMTQQQVAKPAAPKVDPENSNGGIKELGGLLKAVQQQVDTLVTELQTTARQKQSAETGLTNLKSEISALMEDVKRNRVPSAPIAPPRAVVSSDTVLLALNSGNFKVQDFWEVFQAVFLQSDFGHAGENYRIGFCVANTLALKQIVPLDLPVQANLEERFTVKLTGVDNASEDLKNLGPRIEGVFRNSGATRRCVVIATTRCPVPSEGWDNVAVDAVLVSPDGQTPAEQELARWQIFCAKKNGSLAILGLQRAQFRESLKFHLDRLLRPVCAARN